MGSTLWTILGYLGWVSTSRVPAEMREKMTKEEIYACIKEGCQHPGFWAVFGLGRWVCFDHDVVIITLGERKPIGFVTSYGAKNIMIEGPGSYFDKLSMFLSVEDVLVKRSIKMRCQHIHAP